jgi:hypothetical protein
MSLQEEAYRRVLGDKIVPGKSLEQQVYELFLSEGLGGAFNTITGDPMDNVALNAAFTAITGEIGGVKGDLSTLQGNLGGKQNALTQGAGIVISGDTISVDFTGYVTTTALGTALGAYLPLLATGDNGCTALSNVDGQGGFRAVTEQSGQNTKLTIFTHSSADSPIMGGIGGEYLDTSSEDSVRLLWANDAGGNIGLYLIRGEELPTSVSQLSADNAVLNKGEIVALIETLSVAGGLQIPQAISKESNLPSASTAADGAYYYISEMDVTAPGKTGKAWKNDAVQTASWQVLADKDEFFVPDESWITLTADGKLTLTSAVQGWINTALQPARIVQNLSAPNATTIPSTSAMTIALALKQDKVQQGANITITGSTIHAKARRPARVVIASSDMGYTAYDCDYLCNGVNDSAQFAAAVAAIPSTGGEILILEGAYLLTSPWVVEKSGVRIVGRGPGTKILKTGPSNSPLNESTAKTNNAIIYVGGNGCSIEDMEVGDQMEASESGLSIGIAVNVSEICTVRNVVFRNVRSLTYGLQAFSGASVRIRDCVFRNRSTAGDCIGVYSSGANISVLGCDIQASASGDNNSAIGVFVLSSDSGSRVVDCEITVSGRNANGVLSSLSSFNMEVGGCKIDVTGTGGVNTFISGVVLIQGTNHSVHDNHIFVNGSSEASILAPDICGISVTTAHKSICLGNVISVAGNGGVPTGISISTTTNVVCDGNYVSASASGTKDAIAMYLNGCGHSILTNNILSPYVPSGGGYAYGVYITQSAQNLISFRGGAGSATLKGFGIWSIGTNNTYNRITNCDFRYWTQNGGNAYTTSGTSNTTLSGTTTTSATLTSMGSGTVAGLNIV